MDCFEPSQDSNAKQALSRRRSPRNPPSLERRGDAFKQVAKQQPIQQESASKRSITHVQASPLIRTVNDPSLSSPKTQTAKKTVKIAKIKRKREKIIRAGIYPVPFYAIGSMEQMDKQALRVVKWRFPTEDSQDCSNCVCFDSSSMEERINAFLQEEGMALISEKIASMES